MIGPICLFVFAFALNTLLIQQVRLRGIAIEIILLWWFSPITLFWLVTCWIRAVASGKPALSFLMIGAKGIPWSAVALLAAAALCGVIANYFFVTSMRYSPVIVSGARGFEPLLIALLSVAGYHLHLLAEKKPIEWRLFIVGGSAIHHRLRADSEIAGATGYDAEVGRIRRASRRRRYPAGETDKKKPPIHADRGFLFVCGDVGLPPPFICE